MTTISVNEIQRDLLGYLRRVEAGETLLVVRDDHPVAEIKPVRNEETPSEELETITPDTDQVLTVAQMAEALRAFAKPTTKKDIPLAIDPDDYPLS